MRIVGGYLSGAIQAGSASEIDILDAFQEQSDGSNGGVIFRPDCHVADQRVVGTIGIHREGSWSDLFQGWNEGGERCGVVCGRGGG